MRKSASPSRTAFLIGVFILTIIVVQTVGAQEGGAIAFFPTDDTYYDLFSAQAYNQTSSWNESILEVSSWRYQTYLRFDISDIPDGADSIIGVLELYTTSDVAPHSDPIDVYSHNDIDWQEEVRIPTLDNRNMLLLDTTLAPHKNTLYKWNVTQGIVEALSKNAKAVTFVMIMWASAPETAATSFVSKEGTLTEMPRLTIEWADVVPEFSSIITPLVIMATVTALFVAREIVARADERLEYCTGDNIYCKD